MNSESGEQDVVRSKNAAEMLIEGRVVLSDTMPAPKVIPKGKVTPVKLASPEKIIVNQNQFNVRHSEKITAGKPSVLEFKSEKKKGPLVPVVVRAGLPDKINVKEAYSIPQNPFSFSFYTRSQGLPHDDIRALKIDKLGRFWFATIGGGLISYNGTTFNHYTTENGLPGNSLSSLLVDNEGNIWFGVRNHGVTKFDGKYFKTYNKDNGLISDNIESVYMDSGGNFWFASFEGGISFFDGENFTNYSVSSGRTAYPITDIIEDHALNMWFTTAGGGVIKYDRNNFYNYTTEHGLGSNFIRAVANDASNNVWFGTHNEGIIIFDGKYLQNLNENTGLPCNYMNNLFFDSNGYMWIGTRKIGLLKYDGNSFFSFGESEGLLNSFITDIAEDTHNTIWFGTFGAGVGKYNGDIFRHFTRFEGLADSFIREITQDNKDNIWLISNTEGIYILDKYNTLYNYTTDHGLPGNHPRAIMKDSKGNIWIGFVDGNLIKYDGSYAHFFSDIADNNVLSTVVTMWEDSNQNIWIGSLRNGVFKFDGNSFTNYTVEQGLVHNGISKIYDDKKGNIWISSFFGGISKFDGEKFVNYTEKEGLPNHEVFDMVIDSRGALWAATNGNGVYYLRDGKYFFNFKEKHGLGSSFAYSVFEDSNGGIWAGTRMGLSKLIYSDNTSFERKRLLNGGYSHSHNIFFKNYTKNDGFLGIGCNSRAFFEDNEGKIWIGANDILTVFDPQIDIYDTMPPIIHLKSIGLFNNRISWDYIALNMDTILILDKGVEVKNFFFDGLSPWYSLPQNLRLAYDNNYISFRYSGTNSRFKQMIRYQYMLEGIDENWSSFTPRTEAHYGNLPSGKYVFKVRAMNSETVLSDVLEYHFTIMPPWWHTWWAYLIYVVLALSLAAGLISYRKRLVSRREKRRVEQWLLQQEVEVAKKSVEFKQKFLANMSHEIRTPLTGLMGMAEILNKTKLNDQQTEYLQTLIRSGENLKETINLVLDYSKIEAGQYAVNKVLFSMKELLIEAEEYFFSICKNNLDFNKFIEEDVPEYVVTDKNKLFQIISNLISNAVKHTSKGRVGVYISLDKTSIPESLKPGEKCMIKISVSDTGKGISKEEQKKLFKPFYQIEHELDKAFEGTGLGLSICKEVTKILGGEIGLVSQKGQGSTFWFTFNAEISGPPYKSAKQESRLGAQAIDSLKILLVEDNKVNQKVIQLMLETMGHKVYLASNGKQAIDKFALDNFELILMDIQMPEMDGITATAKLRELYKDLPPIVGLSANAFEGDREKYMALGMDEYVTKPVEEEDFKKLIVKLFE